MIGKCFKVYAPEIPLTNAVSFGSIGRTLEELIEGRGGGKPDMAQGGGKEVDKLDEASAMVQNKLSAAAKWLLTRFIASVT